MQRGFGGDFYPQNAKNNLSKTLEKSMNSDQNKNFFKILKKSVAKIVRFCNTIFYLYFNHFIKKQRAETETQEKPPCPPFFALKSTLFKANKVLALFESILE